MSPSNNARGLLLSVLLLSCTGSGRSASSPRRHSSPGGAGHALQFSDHAIVLRHFKDFADTAFTFEAWIQTSSDCNGGTIMSYAKNKRRGSSSEDFNHFLIYNQRDVIACHDYKLITAGTQSSLDEACETAFGGSYYGSFLWIWDLEPGVNLVESTTTWHHLAVTWTAAQGLTKIYKDGLLLKAVETNKTSPLESDGAFMLGNEQDCYGGCTDSSQAFYGLMDEVRLWRTARTREEILANMRKASGLENHKDLFAYWKFNDPDEDGGIHKDHLIAKDSSGNGNDLPLVAPPLHQRVTISQAGRSMSTNSLVFENNYALNPDVEGMPTEDMTVSFWVRTPAYNVSELGLVQDKQFEDIFNYATHSPAADGARGHADAVFIDDAIRIQKYYEELWGTTQIGNLHINTSGSLVVRVNGNREGNGRTHMILLYFAANWIDGDWHHVALTWKYEDGETLLYFDGQNLKPYFKREGLQSELQDPAVGGVDSHMAGKTARYSRGSLVLGQNQECYGGCFSSDSAYIGELANVQIWGRALDQVDSLQEAIQSNMFEVLPANKQDLVAAYNFDRRELQSVGSAAGDSGKVRANVTYGNTNNSLLLWGDAPEWQYSTAPLMDSDGGPVQSPLPGDGGRALYLNNQQVLLHPNFTDFPSTALTVEFWMWTVDVCAQGTPFSYAVGEYDNAFLLYDYTDWTVSVMRDQGVATDRFSGSPANDGSWHHIAVTWQSSDGMTNLYDNGRKVWTVRRAAGQTIPSGGTLVIGREQDCEGGCFESGQGASGKVEWSLFSQDFTGLIDELRIWRTVRSQDEIMESMTASLQFNTNSSTLADHEDLVAYWSFDDNSSYVMKDMTGHGHDLLATTEPEWQVVRWLAECGNGILEGMEECDVGSTSGGNGCSKHCQIEDGWACTATSPSFCSRLSPGQTPTPRSKEGNSDAEAEAENGKSPSSSPSSGSRGFPLWAIIVLSIGSVAIGLALSFFLFSSPRFGEMLEAIPWRRNARSIGGLDPLSPAEGLDMTPNFLSAAPVRHQQGSYQPLPNSNA